MFNCSKKGIIDKNTSIETIRHQVDRLRIEEEKTRTVPENDYDEEEFEEVIGSGLTSETEGNRTETPKAKPKTIPGNRVRQKYSKVDKVEKASKPSNTKSRKKSDGTKTEVRLDNDETAQTVITEIQFIMPKTSQEFEKQLANMKHIPQASRPPAAHFKIPATLKMESGQAVALPPVIINNKSLEKQSKQKLKHQFQSEYDKFSDKEFYKDFRFSFIPLPVPTDELPRKSSSHSG